MKYWYVNDRRVRILDPGAFAAFGATLLLILVWLLPRNETFVEMLEDGESDAVALNYAKLLSAANPNDPRLVQLLARQHLNLGQLDAAEALLCHGDRHTRSAVFQMLCMEALARQHFHHNPGSSERAAYAQTIIEQLGDVRSGFLDTSRRDQMITMALAFNQLALAAEQLEMRARGTGSMDDLYAAAEQRLAAGQHDHAALLFDEVARSASDLAPAAAIAAVTAHAATAQPWNGLTLARELLGQAPGQTDLALTALHLANQLNAASHATTLLAYLDDGGNLQPDQALAAAPVAIRFGRPQIALRFARTVAAAAPTDVSTVARLADIHRWAGDAHGALDHYAYLLEAGITDESTLAQMVALAAATRRHELSIAALSVLAAARLLSPAEVAGMVSAYSGAAQPLAGVAHLERHLRQHADAPPTTRETLWRGMIHLLESDEQIDAAIVKWTQYASSASLTIADRVHLANLHWRSFDIDAALQTLTAVTGDARPEHVDYWRSLLALAWDADRPDLVSTAGQALIQGPAEPDDTEIERMLVTAESAAQRQQVAAFAWQSQRQPRFLGMQIEHALRAGDLHGAELLFAQMDQVPAAAQDVDLLTMRGRASAQAGNYASAARWYRSAIEANRRMHAGSPRADITIGLLWALLETRDNTGLARELERWRERAVDDAGFDRVYAAAHEYLGGFTAAAFWYERASNGDPGDPRLTLGWARALDGLGRVDAAARLRRYVLNHWIANSGRSVAAATGEPGETRPQTLLTRLEIAILRDGNISRPSTDRLWQPQLPGDMPAGADTDTDTELAGVVEELLRQQHYDGARFWLARQGTPARRGADESYHRFAVAARDRDAEALARFTDHPSVTIRVEAQRLLRQEPAALATATAGLTPTATAFDGWQLRRSALDLQHRWPSAVAVAADVRELGNATERTQQLRAAQLFDEVHVETVLKRSTIEFDDTGPGAGVDADGLLASIAVTRPNRLGATRLTIAPSQQDGNWAAGLGIEHEFLPTELLGSRLELAVGEPASTSALMRVIGLRDRVGGALSIQPTARDSSRAQLYLQRYRTRDGDSVARGFELAATHSHFLTREGPAVELQAGAFWTRNTLTTLNQNGAPELTDVTAADLVARDSRRLVVGVALGRGEPGALNRRMPSPQYRLTLTTGYQWPEQEPTFNVAADIGLRVLGDDELAIGYRFDTLPLNSAGGGGSSLNATYTHRLGR